MRTKLEANGFRAEIFVLTNVGVQMYVAKRREGIE